MKIGLWNIDHPECHPTAPARYQKFIDIQSFLNRQKCDVFILTEANSAIQLDDYLAIFSQVSPFYKKGRCYDSPNKYHQVGIYSKLPLEHADVTEPVNGLLCKSSWEGQPLFIYGNVITIKDQWKKDSDKTYSDRLGEQIEILGGFANERFFVGGDFNLRLGWPQKKQAHARIKEIVDNLGWIWPTETQTATVQHVIHSPDLNVTYSIDSTVQHQKGKKDGLSDHPFILIEIDG